MFSSLLVPFLKCLSISFIDMLIGLKLFSNSRMLLFIVFTFLTSQMIYPHILRKKKVTIFSHKIYETNSSFTSNSTLREKFSFYFKRFFLLAL